jgi:hypothetical protein
LLHRCWIGVVADHLVWGLLVMWGGAYLLRTGNHTDY